jgi:hypothetical protein
MMERDSRGFIPVCGGEGVRGWGGRNSISQLPEKIIEGGSTGYFAYFRNCKGSGVKNHEPEAAAISIDFCQRTDEFK